MNRRWLILSAVVVASAATLSDPRARRAGAESAAGTGPSTGPTTAVAVASTTRATSRPSPEVLDLIRKLGDDDEKVRDAAQAKLVDLAGDDGAVADALRQASKAESDPEVRSRAAAAVGLIRDRDANDASPVTLHVADATVADVFAQIGKQAHAEVKSFLPGMPLVAGPGVPANRTTVTVDADRQPFWVVMADVCKQLNLCPVLDQPGQNQIRLFPTPAPRNWMTSAPHQIVGPFWVSAVGLYRSRSIDLIGEKPTTDDQFYARFVVYAEPKLAVTQMSAFTLREAADDAGNSLMPAANAAGPAVPRAFLALRTNRSAPRTVEARLSYPPRNTGQRIAVLRGDVAVTLGQGVQRFEAEDVLTPTPKATKPLPGCTVRLSLARQGVGTSYLMTVQLTRDGMPDAQWYAMGARFNDAVLEDADGRALTNYSWSLDSPDGGEQTIKGTALFTRTTFGANPLVRAPAAGPVQPPPQVGEPKRFVWNVASRFKVVTVPVTFNDLPMP